MMGDIGRSLVRSIRLKTVQDRVCFVHAPKCGGTSVDWALREAFGLKSRFGGEVYRVDTRASANAARLAGMDTVEFRERLLFYQLGKRYARFISGHFPYTDAIQEAFGAKWRFLTLLRDPVDRWFSLYFYNRYGGSPERVGCASLAEYLESEKSYRSAQAYIRLFGELDVDDDLDAAVERSKVHLDAFSVVGVLEDLVRFRARFRERFGVSLSIGRKNTAPVSRTVYDSEITPEIRARVEHLCRHDLRVYEYALTHLA